MKYPRILHYPGSKWSMADWIIEHMPEHDVYLEPFFGSGAVLFNKPRSPLETVNDLDDDVINLFKVIRDRKEELAEKIRWTPYSREEYNLSYEKTDDELEDARRFLVRCWQAIGAKTSDRTGWRSNIQLDKAPHKTWPKQWSELPNEILVVSERLKEVQIENQPAIKIIERYRYPGVFIYADPPYVLSTRSNRMYRYEMTDDDHMELLEILDKHPGPVMLSGYANPLYDERLKHWRREEIKGFADRGKPRTEVVWINPVAADQVGQQTIFSLPGVQLG
ncbi:DNA adenine methylase [Brevibacillus sp. SYP-B805]|uniref:DNA adenine methylase n=1 Tax=Brevibacillus sp. SYP-B805 TaxID=1578199 RepID=UPI0013EBD7B3|nr:DNA adenine methylase [Brevibacillus sp. SYP-B805]NGQ95033.1 DNA adenine methylase [Brevibacillus sp. SYP-B805]